MIDKRSFALGIAAAIAGLVISTSPLADAGSAHAAARRQAVDLADVVKGAYAGDIISDSRGSSQSNVTVTVTRTAPNTVTVSSSARLSTFTVRLTRAMSTIQQTSGNDVFLVDQSKNPWSLDVTVDGASWSGVRQ